MYHLITGPMFSGKTEELQRLVRREQVARRRVVTVIPALDHRSGHSFRSHVGRETSAIPVHDGQQLMQVLSMTEHPDVLALDEAQFFPPELIQRLDEYRDHMNILVAALHRDYRDEVFQSTALLFQKAETMVMLTAVCQICGRDAAYTRRMVHAHGQVFVGGAESYEARCWAHR